MSQPAPCTFHFFSIGGQNLLYLPRSGRLFEPDEAAVAALAELDAGARLGRTAETALAAGDAPLAELAELIASEPTSPLLDAEAPVPPEKGPKRFSIYVSQSCNLSCSYCWNGRGSLGGKPALMDRETAGRVLGSIRESVARGEHEVYSVSFYGGEPLMNFGVVRFLAEGLRALGEELGAKVRLTVDTNATLIDREVAAFLDRHFAQVGISLDGRSAAHDRNRPFSSGRGSFSEVVSKISLFPNPDKLLLRATLTESSESYLETFKALCGHGVDDVQIAYAHTLETDPKACAPSVFVSLERQRREKVEFADYWLGELEKAPEGRVPPVFASYLADLRSFAEARRTVRPCSAGTELRAFDSAGNVFPCILFAGLSGFSMPANNLRDPFAEWNAETRDPCRTCWARYDCSGGCFATNYRTTGALYDPHPQECAETMSNLEVKLYTLATAKRLCPGHLK